MGRRFWSYIFKDSKIIFHLNKPSYYILIFVSVFISGCTSQGHSNTSETSLNWINYRNEAVGYEITLPELYESNEWEGGSGVAFNRNGDETVMLIR